MKNTILMCLLLSQCIITSQEKAKLEGKMFSFPEEHSASYVKLTPAVSKKLSSATVCLRFYTDQVEGQLSAFFSLNTSTQPDAFVILRHMPSRSYPQQYELHVGNKPIFFNGLDYTLNVWNSLCATWNGVNGMSQMIINNTPSVKKLTAAGLSIEANPSIILGQYQDGFAYSFVGHISDVHMWDYVLSSSEIQKYMQGGPTAYKPGNYLNWNTVQYSISGTVFLE